MIPDEYKWKGESIPDHLNLSNIWLILGALFCGINLSRLASRYLTSSGERSRVYNLHGANPFFNFNINIIFEISTKYSSR